MPTIGGIGFESGRFDAVEADRQIVIHRASSSLPWPRRAAGVRLAFTRWAAGAAGQVAQHFLESANVVNEARVDRLAPDIDPALGVARRAGGSAAPAPGRHRLDK